MRLIMTTLLIVNCGVALAHSLPAEEGLAAQISHQVSGLHHWPYLALLMAAVCVIMHLAKRGKKAE